MYVCVCVCVCVCVRDMYMLAQDTYADIYRVCSLFMPLFVSMIGMYAYRYLCIAGIGYMRSKLVYTNKTASQLYVIISYQRI